MFELITAHYKERYEACKVPHFVLSGVVMVAPEYVVSLVHSYHTHNAHNVISYSCACVTHVISLLHCTRTSCLWNSPIDCLFSVRSVSTVKQAYQDYL